MRNWDINLINIVSGISCALKGVGILIFAGAMRRLGAKMLMAITLFASAALVLVFGFTQSLPIYLVVIIALGILGGAYEKNGGMGLTANWWPTKKGVVLGFTTMGIILMNVVYVPMMPKLLGALGLGGGMAVIAVIIAIVAVITLLCVKNTPEEAGEYPDGDPEFAVDGAKIAEEMKNYKSPFTLGKLAKDPTTWFMAFGAGFAFMAVMSYIASAIPTMIGYGYEPGFATMIFAVGGVCGIIGSFLFGVIDQKMGTKKAFIIYFICITIGFICTLFMPNSPVFCWI